MTDERPQKSSIPPALRALPISWMTVVLIALIVVAAIVAHYLDASELSIGLFGAASGLLMRIKS